VPNRLVIEWRKHCGWISLYVFNFKVIFKVKIQIFLEVFSIFGWSTNTTTADISDRVENDPLCEYNSQRRIGIGWTSYIYSSWPHGPQELHKICIFGLRCQQQATRGLCFRFVRSAGRPCFVRPSVNTYFTWCDISLLSGGISMKLGMSDHHTSGHCYTAGPILTAKLGGPIGRRINLGDAHRNRRGPRTFFTCKRTSSCSYAWATPWRNFHTRIEVSKTIFNCTGSQ